MKHQKISVGEKKISETESQQYQSLNGVATLKKCNFELRTEVVPIQFRFSSIFLSIS